MGSKADDFLRERDRWLQVRYPAVNQVMGAKAMETWDQVKYGLRRDQRLANTLVRLRKPEDRLMRVGGGSCRRIHKETIM